MKTKTTRPTAPMKPRRGVVLPDDACPYCGAMTRPSRAPIRSVSEVFPDPILPATRINRLDIDDSSFLLILHELLELSQPIGDLLFFEQSSKNKRSPIG